MKQQPRLRRIRLLVCAQRVNSEFQSAEAKQRLSEPTIEGETGRMIG